MATADMCKGNRQIQVIYYGYSKLQEGTNVQSPNVKLWTCTLP